MKNKKIWNWLPIRLIFSILLAMGIALPNSLSIISVNFLFILAISLALIFLLGWAFRDMIENFLFRKLDIAEFKSIIEKKRINLEDGEYFVISGKDWKFKYYELGSCSLLKGKLEIQKEFGEDKSSEIINFFLYYPESYFDNILRIVDDNNFRLEKIDFKFVEKLKYTKSKRGIFTSIVIFFLIFFVIVQSTQKSFDQSISTIRNYTINIFRRDKRYKVTKSENLKDVFSDIRGYEEPKKKLIDLCQSLKNKHLKEIGYPQGIILYGPPGTGKTMLANAFCKESGAKYLFSSNGAKYSSNILVKAVSDPTLNALESDFEEASRLAKEGFSIFYIDEADKCSNNGIIGSGKCFSEILSIIDGPEGRVFKNVILIMTANDISAFDPALLRSGRITNLFEIYYPSKTELYEIIRVKIEKLYKEFLGINITREINSQIVIKSRKIIENIKDKGYKKLVGADIEKAISVPSDNKGKGNDSMFLRTCIYDIKSIELKSSIFELPKYQKDKIIEDIEKIVNKNLEEISNSKISRYNEDFSI